METIGARYKLIEQVGTEDIGEIYRAFDERTNTDVEITLAPQGTYPNAAIEAFMRESRTLALMTSAPYIVQVIDYGKHRSRPYQVTRHLPEGVRLSQVLDRSHLADDLTVSTALEIAKALDATHQQGVVHGGVNPLSIIYTTDEQAWLSNFALVSLVETGGKLSSVLPAYLPPERADGGDLTPHTDVYGLGVTLFQCLTGHLPYQAKSRMSLVMAQVSKPVPLIRDYRPDLPNDLQRVINFALAKEPSVRYQSPLDLANDFHTAMTDI